MRRRTFLAMMAATVLDPERLLWVPGKKMISVPKVEIFEDASPSLWFAVPQDYNMRPMPRATRGERLKYVLASLA